MDVSLIKCNNTREVLENLRKELDKRDDLLPEDENASIVIKPNLNSNLDALTGNTTDLRVLGSVLRILTERGYKNITTLEGPNGGFHRDGIDVFSRNCIDTISAYYGVKFRDVNYESDYFPLEFSGSGEVKVARAFKECDLFVNIPKLKTHYETLISVALKSLIGVLVGQANKAKAHASLYENILRLNDAIQADLYIVDGLIAMEGTGPSAGKPVRTNLIMVGADAFEIDILAAKIMGFRTEECPLIQRALKTGRISRVFVSEAEATEIPFHIEPFESPHPGILARMVVMPGLKGIVRTVRNSAPVSALLKREAIRRVMLFLSLTQEVIMRQERDVILTWDEKKCKSCGTCARYCPQMLDLPEALDGNEAGCLNCLYCYAVCPNGAIGIEGELGYYKEQIRRYGMRIREIA